jgi:hypothetical protein
MNIFAGLLSAAARIVTLPLTVAADVLTLGGVLTDRDRSYTGKQIDNIVNDLEVDE